MIRPRHPKPDANQAEIIDQLRALGFIVHDISGLGGDCLDLFVMGWNRETQMWSIAQVEIKTDDGALTVGEEMYIDRVMEMTDDCAPVIVARSVEDVLRWFGRA
jgi:hypothetical protein